MWDHLSRTPICTTYIAEKTQLVAGVGMQIHKWGGNILQTSLIQYCKASIHVALHA